MLAQFDTGEWLANQVPAIVIAVGVLFLIVTGRLVPGPTHNRSLAREDRAIARGDRFLELLLRATVTTEKAAEVMEAQQETAEEIAQRAASEAVDRARKEGRIR